MAVVLPHLQVVRPRFAAYVTPGDVAEMNRVAERLEKDHPRWMVMFGLYS